jgi:hypothetical protein
MMIAEKLLPECSGLKHSDTWGFVQLGAVDDQHDMVN